MANKYAGTQTEKNLMAALAGESEARNKYTYFASKAKKEGYEQIAALFLKTADNEKEHAKLWFKELAANGQIATQYVDLDGNATADIDFNPNGSLYAIEGITSPDGRVFGKMGHSERIADGLYKNVPGEYDIRMFEAAVKYFNK